MQTEAQLKKATCSLSRRTKVALITSGSIAIIVGTNTAASAFGLGGIGNLLSNVQRIAAPVAPLIEKHAGVPVGDYLNKADNYLQQANQYWNQISGFYQAIVSKNLTGILGNTALVLGQLGIPDPQGIRSQALEKAKTPDEVQKGQEMAEAANRAIANGIASTVLGQEGQALLKAQQVGVAGAVSQNGQIAGAVQKMTVTQDIQKAIATQQANQTSIAGRMSDQLASLQLQGAASNLMLSDIGGTLTQELFDARRERDNASLSKSMLGSQIYLPSYNLAGDSGGNRVALPPTDSIKRKDTSAVPLSADLKSGTSLLSPRSKFSILDRPE